MAGAGVLSEEEEVSRVEAMVGPKSEENGRRKYGIYLYTLSSS